MHLSREAGQAVIEYALLLALLIVVVIVVLAIGIGPAMGNVFSQLRNL